MACDFLRYYKMKKIKKFKKKKIAIILSLMHEPCLIRCSRCDESKSIFRPWNMNWLCIDCYKWTISFNWIERRASDSEVAGPSPASSAKNFSKISNEINIYPCTDATIILAQD